MADNQELNNIVLLEHINLEITDQSLASDFYFETLGLTRDPYTRTGSRNIWCNIGYQQIHMPTSTKANIFRGVIGLLEPSLDKLLIRLNEFAGKFSKTKFQFTKVKNESNSYIEIICPYGNIFQVYEPSPTIHFRGDLGILYVEIVCEKDKSLPIGAFYEYYVLSKYEVITRSGQKAISIKAGPYQRIIYREKADNENMMEDDGHHIAIYIVHFASTYQKLKNDNLIYNSTKFQDTTETLEDALKYYQFRIKNIIDINTKQVIHTLEHEVRSLYHPNYMRPLINRFGQVQQFNA